MIENIKKSTTFILAVAMLGGIFTPTMAFASGSYTNFEDVLMDEFIEEFSEENFEIENVDVHLNELAVEVSTENEYGDQISAEVELTLGGEYIFFTTQHYNEVGFLEEHQYYIDVRHMQNFAGADGNLADFVIHNAQTNEEVQIDLFHEGGRQLPNTSAAIDYVVCQVTYGVNLAFDLLGGFLNKQEVVLIGGVTMVRVGVDYVIDTVPIIGPLARMVLNIEQAIKGFSHDPGVVPLQTMNQTHSHFNFFVIDGEIYIGEGMDVNEAANRLRNGESVWSATATDAREAAWLAGHRLPSLIHNDARSGFRTELYLDHITPSPRTGGRAYFGTNLRRGWW